MRKTALLIGALAAALMMIGIGSGAAAGAAGAYVCDGTLPSGTYHGIVVPAGATCDGTNAVVTVHGGIDIGPGATFILGGDEMRPTGTITGGVRADNAASVQIHFARINGGLAIVGGNGFFSTVEDSVINGGAVINGYTGFWLGFIRNTVHGGANLSNNVLEDPDANEFVTNTISGNLACFGNDPAPQVGDSDGSPNVVSGQKIGQCVDV
jgi:hypothetical protein